VIGIVRVLPSRAMSTENIVQLLIAERERLNRAIEALQSATVRRGRPPGSGRKPGRKPGRKAGRRGMSAAARKAQSARMKAYWAQRRKQKA
jgi:hypothetical protein